MVGPRVLTARWLLLCALAFGLVGMHHLIGESHHCDDHATTTSGIATVTMLSDGTFDTTPTISQEPRADCCDEQVAGGHGAPGSGHELLHLCLAILAAGLVLAALLASWFRANRSAGLRPRLTPASWRLPRTPPDSAAIVTSLGVLRL